MAHSCPEAQRKSLWFSRFSIILFNLINLYKANFIFILFCSIISDLSAQENLVLNPSFEDTTSMTSGYPYLITSNWWSPNGFDADYFTPYCQELCCGTGGLHCVGEIDYLGYQVAQDSSSYLGMVIYESTGDTKDYGQGFLSNPLESGISYCVGIWIALADSSSYLSCDFQVAFTNDVIQGGDLNNLFLEDYVAFDISEINDSLWTYFEGTYLAHGGEQFIYLGSNTPNDILTCVQTLPPTWLNNACYILVDNVSVKQTVLCSVNQSEAKSQNISILYTNPVQSNLFISGLDDSSNCRILILDSFGRLCKSLQTRNEYIEIDTNSLPQGVYFLIIEQENNWYQNRFMKL